MIARVKPAEIDTTTMPTLDARKHRGREQIRGALRYDPKALMTDEQLALPLPHDGRIVVYSDDDASAERIAARLIAQGYRQAVVLEGGFDAYKEANLPVEGATQEQPIPGDESAGIPRG
jgi:rhodanese-related sulfurtransferase